MNVHSAVFEAAAGISAQLPACTLPEIAFSGRSNVGKSSLINRILNRKGLARTSATPGKTATINFYRLDTMRLVDLPGYGYAKVSDSERRRWSELIEGYFDDDRDLRLVIQLWDMRHDPSKDDYQMLEYMLERGLQVENLYIDFYAYTLTAVPWISDTKMFLDTDLAFKLDAWKLMGEHNDVTLNDFYEMFVTANNEQILMFPINNAIVSSQFRNGGSLMAPAGQTKEHLDTLDLGVREELFESQLAGYERIVELAKAYDIDLLFIETPKYEKLLKDTRDGSYMELLTAMTAWAEKANAPYLLAESFAFDHADGANFQDLIHLSGQGRKAYCEMLSQHIGNNLAQSALLKVLVAEVLSKDCAPMCGLAPVCFSW